MKRHLFTLLAAISLLICLFFVVATAISFATDCQVPLGHSAQRIYSFQAEMGELRLNGWLASFGRKGVSTSNETYLGVEVQKQDRPRDARTGEPEATGFSVSVPPPYPIGLFAILPAVWLVQTFRQRKRIASQPEPASTSR